MLRTLMITILCMTSLTIYAKQIPFCVTGEENNKVGIYFALDGEVFYVDNVSETCFKHETKGKSIVIFTKGFDLTYQSSRCGNADPCLLPLTHANGKTLVSFVIASRTLLPHYE